MGIEVTRSKSGIFISQQKYIHDLLRTTGKFACRSASTPIDPNNKLRLAKEDTPMDNKMYQRLVRKLIYMSQTRPDITYTVSIVSQIMHKLEKVHLQTVYNSYSII